MEEYQNVKTRLSAQNSPEALSRKTSGQSTKDKQADDIRKIQAELNATKAQLNDIQMTSTKRVLPGDEDPQVSREHLEEHQNYCKFSRVCTFRRCAQLS